MIEYEYECMHCGYHLIIRQSIKDEPLTQCSECEQDALRRIITPPLYVMVKGTTTVGALAEQNARTMSPEEKERLTQKTQKEIDRIPEHLKPASKPSEPLPPMPEWVEKPRTKTNKEINKMNPQQLEKYVHTGE